MTNLFPLISLAKKIKKPSIYYYAKNTIKIYLMDRKLKEELCSSSVILVYQMGKVGSRTVFKSLKTNLKDQSIYHVHTLDSQKANNSWRNINLYDESTNWSRIQSVWISKVLSNRLETLKKKELKVITIVRDPIARNISLFFENVKTKKIIRSGSFDIKDLIKAFWKEKYVTSNPFNWFDEELKRFLEIDVYSLNFPKEQGYGFIQHKQNKINILLLKLETFKKSLQTSLSEFLDLEKLIITPDNLARKKFYYDIYNLFKSEITFSQEYLEEIYGHPLVQYFYTEKEIENFKIKWSK